MLWSKLKRYMSDVSTQHCKDQWVVKDGYVIHYDDRPLRSVVQGRAYVDDLYSGGGETIDVQYMDASKVEVFKQVKVNLS